MTENIQDKIDLYLMGKMSESESKQFESELQNNAELKDQCNFTKLVVEELQAQTEMRNKIGGWNKDGKAYSSTLKYVIGSIAAAVVVGIFLLVPTTNEYEPNFGSKSRRPVHTDSLIRQDSCSHTFDEIDSIIKSHPDFE